MAELAPLETLCAAGAGADRAVALRHGQVLDRRALRARAGAWAALLRERAGMDWALHSSDGFELLAALFGAWAAGKIVWLPADGLPATIAALRPRLGGFLGDFAGVECLNPASGSTDADAGAVPPGATLMVYTSGSTGEPIAIAKTLAQLQAEVIALHALWGERVGDATVIASVPHRHIYGLLFKLLWAAARGAPFLAHSSGYAEEALEGMRRGPCVWIASPALLKRLPEDLDWLSARTHLRAVFSSGGPLDPEAARKARGLLGQAVIEVYGSSESGGIATRAQGDGESAWRPLPGVVVELNRATETLAVRSPWIGEPATWITADRASIGADGRFLLQGRVDRIAKVEEKRVSLDAIERALGTHAWVQLARVLQLDDGRLGAVIVPTSAGGAALTELGTRELGARLRTALAESVEPVALPRRWRIVAALPQDALGKCTQAACAALFEASAEERPIRPLLLGEQRDAHRSVLKLRAQAGLACFDGHFPGVPVLAGVVQVHWAIGFARERFSFGARFHALEQLKFKRVIVADTDLELELRHDAARGRIEFAYRSAAGEHSSGCVLFGD